MYTYNNNDNNSLNPGVLIWCVFCFIEKNIIKRLWHNSTFRRCFFSRIFFNYISPSELTLTMGSLNRPGLM